MSWSNLSMITTRTCCITKFHNVLFRKTIVHIRFRESGPGVGTLGKSVAFVSDGGHFLALVAESIVWHLELV